MRRFVRIAFVAFLTLVLAAIIVQDHTPLMPLGLFNSGRGAYAAGSWGCLFFVVASLFVLSRELRSGHTSRLASAIRGVVVFAVILEALVTIVDLGWMSSRPDAPLGGPYYEMHGKSGAPIILRKHRGGSPFGFRTAAPYAKTPGAYRILFLGDSYTEGSGRRAECNYPTVVQRELRERGRNVEVMNAGVSGYGPAQALALLRELAARGYRFDAVVYNFLVENDFTDNLPGTERRVVAGMAFRFPRSRFLRLFHPLNSRTFRTAMFTRALISIHYELHDFSALGTGPCEPEPEHLDGLPDTVRGIVLRKLADAERVIASEPAIENATGAVREMAREVRALGVPFVVVVFPDRSSVDPELRAVLDADSTGLRAAAELRTVVRERLPGIPLVNASEALDEAGSYRRVDTHLSDYGNVEVGEYVGRRLDTILE